MPMFTGSDPAYKHRLEYYANKIIRFFPTRTMASAIYAQPEQEWIKLVNLGTVRDADDRHYTGTGAPSLTYVPNGGIAGDFYFRTDTPGTANQRIYICTVGTGSGSLGTWVALTL